MMHDNRPQNLENFQGLTQEDLEYHRCDPALSSWEYDAQGIELCRACDVCRAAKLARYRPEILSGYSEDDVSEPIDPEW